MRVNSPKTYAAQTHEGAPANPHLTPLKQLRRTVLSCLLWEKTFYEDGQDVGARIEAAADKVKAEDLASLAIEAREKYHLRHVPLLLLLALVKRGGVGSLVGRTIATVVQRPDELAELLALYWRNGKRPLTKQLKVGLGLAFRKFSAYQLAKYNRDGAVKLRDVLFMVHAKPSTEAQAATWKQLVDGSLAPPDTWEVELSAGKDKCATWTRLLSERKLGYLALLRNLRNMTEVGVDRDLISGAILERRGAERVLPFRYVAAARACPQLEPVIDGALRAGIDAMPKLPGVTVVLVDVSGSMKDPLSAKSDLTRMDAACALAAMVNGNVRMFSFSNDLVEVPPRRGMAGVDALKRSQMWSGTQLAAAVQFINTKVACDRLIVVTDEQARGGRVPDPRAERAYLINVAPYKNSVNFGAWIGIDGFSEAVLRFIYEVENDR